MRVNIYRRRRAFVGVVSIAKLLVRRLPSRRSRCYAYVHTALPLHMECTCILLLLLLFYYYYYSTRLRKGYTMPSRGLA